MRRSSRRKTSGEHTTWMPMSDMLASTLMILCLFIAVSTILRAMNAKPPVIKLADTHAYRFDTGSFLLSKTFKQTLRENAVPQISRTIHCYGIDTVEIIGHTDGRPGGLGGNLDYSLGSFTSGSDMQEMVPGSNIDLGLLRAISVKAELESSLSRGTTQNVGFRVLSAGSTISPDGNFLPAKNLDESSRRRIEIRFLRLSQTPFIPICS